MTLLKCQKLIIVWGRWATVCSHLYNKFN